MEATTTMAALSAVSRKELAEAEAAEAAARATLRDAESRLRQAIDQARECEAAYLDATADPAIGADNTRRARDAWDGAAEYRQSVEDEASHASARHEAANERLADLRHGLGLPHPSPAGGAA